ncbi:MAG: hypothetical protein K0R66_219 [Gammaproteobacteria bacterium]|jgi:hypothetical protein|nr:hypothetical protein [Gammaproteobacteria bacterium]
MVYEFLKEHRHTVLAGIAALSGYTMLAIGATNLKPTLSGGFESADLSDAQQKILVGAGSAALTAVAQYALPKIFSKFSASRSEYGAVPREASPV